MFVGPGEFVLVLQHTVALITTKDRWTAVSKLVLFSMTSDLRYEKYKNIHPNYKSYTFSHWWNLDTCLSQKCVKCKEIKTLFNKYTQNNTSVHLWDILNMTEKWHVIVFTSVRHTYKGSHLTRVHQDPTWIQLIFSESQTATDCWESSLDLCTLSLHMAGADDGEEEPK